MGFAESTEEGLGKEKKKKDKLFCSSILILQTVNIVKLLEKNVFPSIAIHSTIPQQAVINGKITISVMSEL